MKYDHIVFDFDGTLSDTYPCFTSAFLDMLRDFGVNEDYKKVYGLLKISVGTALKAFASVADYKTMDISFHDYHNIRAVTEQKPMAEAEELLRFIKATGGHNYIYSHSGIIVQQLVNIWGWRELFDGVIDNRLGAPRKPDPTGLNIICERYGIDRTHAIMVGDRELDTEAGKNAGMDGCLFDPENFYPGIDVTYRINSLSELKGILL